MAKEKDVLEQLLDNAESAEISFDQEDGYLAPLLEFISMIKDDSIRSFVRTVLLNTAIFWSSPASVLESVHPPDEYGAGGNVLHTRRVVRACYLLAQAQDRSEHEQDILYAAALIHDVTKITTCPDGSIAFDPLHSCSVDRFVEIVRQTDLIDSPNDTRSTTTLIEPTDLGLILRLCRIHQGKWGPLPELYPITTLEWVFHLADLVACNLHFLIDGMDVNISRWIDSEESVEVEEDNSDK